MNTIRRVTTGHDVAGRSVVVDDGPPAVGGAAVHWPGYSVSLISATKDGQLVIPDASMSYLPGAGETRLASVTFPPDSVLGQPDIDFPAMGEELAGLAPGLAELMEIDNPGMHTTPTVDYVVVTAGLLWLEVDDGAAVELGVGDVVVQPGTRHAWRNKSDQAATIVVALIGA